LEGGKQFDALTYGKGHRKKTEKWNNLELREKTLGVCGKQNNVRKKQSHKRDRVKNKSKVERRVHRSEREGRKEFHLFLT